MDNELKMVREVVFDASPERVWDLLINPDKTRKYMFGCAVISTWKPGNPVIWKGQSESGEEVVFVQGEVLDFQEGRSLTISMIDPNTGIAVVPENFMKLTYELSEEGDGTKLKVIQSGDSKGEKMAERIAESGEGWDSVIPLMKNLI